MDNVITIDTSLLQFCIEKSQQRKRNNMIKAAGEQAIKEIKANPILSKQEIGSAEKLIRKMFGL